MTNKECPICSTSTVKFQQTLRGYPLGNIYLKNFDLGRNYLKDFTLTQCRCGHLMGYSSFPSEFFYNENYPYLGTSITVMERHNFSVNFCLGPNDQTNINNIIDIGCSSMNLLRKFKLTTKIRGDFVGIDPVPMNEIPEDIYFINGFFETSDYTLTQGDVPNLILLDNVLEHIVDLRYFLSKLVQWIHKGDLVYVCVPSLEIMINEMRFEEISHEHVHYFSMNQLNRLFSYFGFRSLRQSTKEIQSRGYNFVLFRFEEPTCIISDFSPEVNALNIEEMLKEFRHKLKKIEFDPKFSYWGVCASELTPSIAYFMENSLDVLIAIFDTTESKVGKYMPGVKAKVLPWSQLVEVPPSDFLYVTVPSMRNSVIPNLRKMGFSKFHTIND